MPSFSNYPTLPTRVIIILTSKTIDQLCLFLNVYKWNYTIYTLLCLDSLIQHDLCEIRQYIVPFRYNLFPQFIGLLDSFQFRAMRGSVSMDTCACLQTNICMHFCQVFPQELNGWVVKDVLFSISVLAAVSLFEDKQKWFFTKNVYIQSWLHNLQGTVQNKNTRPLFLKARKSAVRSIHVFPFSHDLSLHLVYSQIPSKEKSKS